MKYRITLLVTILSLGLTFPLSAQNPDLEISKISTIVSEFYNWYIHAIKDGRNSEFQPKFSKNKESMTSLNFSQYVNNLKKYKLTDSLICIEKRSYQDCIYNLEKIKFSDFDKKYNDLDDLERINCDWGNYYRWIGGQEAIDGIKILKVDINNINHAVVKIEKTKTNSDMSLGTILVKMNKVEGLWLINEITVP
jgi:hypothetical protein